jgi:hypothetical protein
VRDFHHHHQHREHLHVLRVGQVGHLRPHLHPHVHAAGVPSRLYPAAVPAGGFSHQLLHAHEPLSVDDFERGSGKIHAQGCHRDPGVQFDPHCRGTADRMDPFPGALDDIGTAHRAGRGNGHAGGDPVKLEI